MNTVFGEQYSGQQAIDYANTVVDEFKDYFDGFELKPKYLIVAKNDESTERSDEYSYIVRYEYMYDGIELNVAGSKYSAGLCSGDSGYRYSICDKK